MRFGVFLVFWSGVLQIGRYSRPHVAEIAAMRGLRQSGFTEDLPKQPVQNYD